MFLPVAAFAVPAGHKVQLIEPSSEKVPGGQGSQVYPVIGFA